MRKTLIRYAATIITIVFVLNLAAYKFYWYLSIFGFDKVMHTLGGICVAMLIAWKFWLSFSGVSSRKLFWQLLVLTFVVGVAWEIYEYFVQWAIKPVAFANIPDSIGDIIFDTIGGAIGAYLVIRLRRRYNTF